MFAYSRVNNSNQPLIILRALTYRNKLIRKWASDDLLLNAQTREDLVSENYTLDKIDNDISFNRFLDYLDKIKPHKRKNQVDKKLLKRYLLLTYQTGVTSADIAEFLELNIKKVYRLKDVTTYHATKYKEKMIN
jgi:hypothetical protein